MYRSEFFLTMGSCFQESKMSDKAEVLNKTNTSDTSTIDENTPNHLITDEKISSNQVVKFIEDRDGTKLKIFSNSSQAQYTGDINPVTGMRPKLSYSYLAK